MPPMSRTHARFGWSLLLLSLCFGAALETLEAFRVFALVGDPWRARMWSLAHFHGAALGLVNLVYAPWAEAAALSATTQSAGSWCLRAGSVLMPLGFVLGGVGAHETDPSLGVLLAPVGAGLIIVTAFVQTRAAWAGASTPVQKK